MELETNFGPINPVRESKAEIELVMAEGSHSTTYFVEFNHLASRIQWDNHALLQQAYKGLARHIKNEMVHHDQPVTLLDLHNSWCKLIQAIDYRYWERKAEITCEANPMSMVDPRGDPKAGRNPKATSKGKALENLKPSLHLSNRKTGQGQQADPSGVSVLHGQQPLPVLWKNWAYLQRVPKVYSHCSQSPCCHRGVTGVLHGGGKKRLSSFQPPTPPRGCVSPICAQTIVTLNASITTPDTLIILVTSESIPDMPLMSLVDSGSLDHSLTRDSSRSTTLLHIPYLLSDSALLTAPVTP